MNDITTTVQHPHGRNEKMTRSVDTLKELYTVAVGVALVMAVEKLSGETTQTSVFGSQDLWLFLVTAVTLIPFYHGAFRHMDDIYVFADPGKRPGSKVLLLDYLLLMCEAGLLVWLSTKISDLPRFTKGFLALLAVDVLWALVTGVFTSEKRGALKWGLLNLVVLTGLGIVTYWPCQRVIPAVCLFVIAVLRSVLDYALSHKLYFPPEN